MNEKLIIQENVNKNQLINLNKQNQAFPNIQQQQNFQGGNPQQQSFNQSISSQFEPCISNSGTFDNRVQDNFIQKNEMGQLKTLGQINSLNRNSYHQSQPNNVVPISSPNYIFQNNQLIFIQQSCQLNQSQPNNNQDSGILQNQQQFSPLPQQQKSSSKIKFIGRVPDQNPTLIEKDNNFNNQANQSNPPILIDWNLFNRQIPKPKPKPQEEIPQIENSLFQRIQTQQIKTIEKPIEDVNNDGFQQLQMNTIYQTKIINCFYCRTAIHKQQIGLNCLHLYHQECFQDIIKQQINTGKCICLCNQKIPQKQLLTLLTQELKDQLFANQLNKIIKSNPNLINMGK
ncbi:unnamed protein product [Paramecium pentaurelia]|uniref:RING-type domain-containing protein n=1 Tax=Paramecium pentaurelia TaxID=43138 RepID=A0A8S1WFZ7_9CILI|nr:unnamed protein product [Paramecium pentaurelia]